MPRPVLDLAWLPSAAEISAKLGLLCAAWLSLGLSGQGCRSWVRRLGLADLGGRQGERLPHKEISPPAVLVGRGV